MTVNYTQDWIVVVSPLSYRHGDQCRLLVLHYHVVLVLLLYSNFPHFILKLKNPTAALRLYRTIPNV